MERAFASKKSTLWLTGVFVLVIGFIVAALILPTTSKVRSEEQPNIHVPKMQNVPPPEAPKMRLDTGRTSGD